MAYCGGGVPPNQTISVFFLGEKTFIALKWSTCSETWKKLITFFSNYALLIVKNLKAEIKSWKKDLGHERAQKIKAERKLNSLETRLKVIQSKRKESTSCQTNATLDVPYSVSDPLHPSSDPSFVIEAKKLGTFWGHFRTGLP